MQYNVSVFITEKVANTVGEEARRKARTYIQEAFDQTPHDVFFNFVNATPSAPTEIPNPDDNFTTVFPCNPWYSQDYPNLALWLDDWLDCNSTEASDANLLITAADPREGAIAHSKDYPDSVMLPRPEERN